MRRRAALAALSGLLVLVAACGSSSSKSSSSTTASSKTSVSASVGASAFTSTRCAQAVKEMADVGTKMGQAMTGQASDLQQTVKEFDAIANAAPGEIKSDIKIVAKAYSTFVQAMIDAHITAGAAPSPDAIQKLEEASKSVDTEEVKAASERVQTWFQTKCGK